MPNRTGRTLLTLAIFIAACEGPVSSAAPSGPATVPPAAAASPSTPTPSATPIVRPTILPRATTFDDCIGVDDIQPPSPFVDAGTTIGRAGVDLQVTRITERFGVQRSVVPPERQLSSGGVGLLVGGHEFLTSPSTYYEGYQTPLGMVAATITLTLDGHQPAQLATRIVPGNEYFDQFAVAVPDVPGAGTMTWNFTWTDKCFEFEASGTSRVEVVPTSVTRDCALERDGYFEQLEALIKPGLAVGDIRTKYFIPEHAAKYFGYANPAIDAFLLYLFDKEQPTLTAGPGALVPVQNRSGDLHLSGMQYWVWTRKSVATAVQDYPPEGAVEVLHRSPAARADGTWRLRLPSDPGRYVVGLEFAFDSHCISGLAWAMVNVTVE